MQTRAPPAFGETLRRYRLTAGLTQEALAARAGLSARTVSDLECGVKHRPHPSTVVLLAAGLGLTGEERAGFEAARRAHAETVALGSVAAIGTASACPDAGCPLVGRAHELALLRAHLAGEGPPLLLLAGEPGIGKTRLLREAVRLAGPQGWAVLAGGCSRSGGQQPFAPFLDALQPQIAALTPADRRRALQGCAWLVRLLPELAAGEIEPLPDWQLTPEQERRLLFTAVGRFLANVAGVAGTLLVFDDLQWAGADALALLAGALQQVPQAPVRAVGAYRDTEVAPEHPLMVTVAELAEAQRATQRQVEPLGQAEAEDLFVALIGGQDRAVAALAPQVVQRAGGVPFFLVSYAHSLGGQSELGRPEVPWDLRQSIRRRLAALPIAAREVLDVAALVGRSVEPALLLAVVAQPEAAVLGALDVTCQARLLAEGEAGYQFAHDLIREVVEAGIGRGRCQVLHRQIGEALEEQAARLGAVLPVAVLAYHYSRSDAEGKALRYLELAGDEARDQAAHASAEGHYREVVARLDGLGRAVDAARVREKLGAVLYTMAHFGRALEVLEQAAETLRLAGDVTGLGRVVARIGQVHAGRGKLEEGVARLRPQLEALSAGGPSHSLATLYAALAGLDFEQGQYPAALVAATHAAEVARAVGDRELLAGATYQRGVALVAMGRDEEAIAALEEASTAAEAGGHLRVLAWAAQYLALLAEDRGNFDRCRWYGSRMLETGERLGDPVVVRNAQMRLAALAFFTGEWAEARSCIERFPELPDRMPIHDGGAALELGRLLLAEGAWEQAARHLEQCSAIQRSIRRRVIDRVAESLLAERDLHEGRPGEALARLLPLLDREGMEEHVVTTYLLPVLAWAYLELDDTVQAARTIGDALRRARAAQHRLHLVDALRVQALVALREGDVDTAARALDEGVTLARALPYPHGEGRLLEVYGRLHLDRGEPMEARERLEAALAIFRRLGARKDAERTGHLLAMLGRRTAVPAT